MKRSLRKILALLMALVLVGGMVPAALAAVSSGDINWLSETTNAECRSSGHVPVFANSVNNGELYLCSRCQTWGVLTTTHTHDWQYFKSGDVHYKWCADSTCEYYDPANWIREAHDANCGCEVPAASAGLILTKSDNLKENNTYNYGDHGTWVEVKADLASTVTGTYEFTFVWSGHTGTPNTNVSEDPAYSYVFLDTKQPVCEVSCTVTATNTSDSSKVLTGTVTWKASVGAAIEVGATVYNTSTGYKFDAADDEGSTSVLEQIYRAVGEQGSGSDNYILDHVVFDDVDVTGGLLYASTAKRYYYGTASSYYDMLGDVAFYPTADYVGQARFPFTAYYYSSNFSGTAGLQSFSGAITFDVKDGGVDPGVVYNAIAGEAVLLNESDFVEFWAEKYPYGQLESVSFGGFTNAGNLYDAYGTIAGKLVTGACYYNPSSASQIGLDNLTFVPKNSLVTAATISFTAKGTKSYSAAANNSATENGSITILYTAAAVTPIDYLAAGTYVELQSADFIAKYKEVMGVSTTVNGSSLYIQLLKAPTYGSLRLNYISNGQVNASAVTLTDKNILSYQFSCRSNTVNGIEDVVYVPGTYTAADEAIPYACYYGNTLKFVGTVNFGAAEPIAVEYVSAGITPVSFSAADFSSSALMLDGFCFGVPSYGTLYRSYANGTGTRATEYDVFTAGTSSYGSTYSVNTLTYVPAPGYVGVVEIPVYSTHSSTTRQSLGTVKIFVGRSFTDVLGTVSAWAAPYINKLSAQGIVNGTDTGMTKYSPTKTVTYGEALKLIMMAAGYPEQAKTNTHWASGFLTAAYKDGLISSSTAIDLNAEVTRDVIAELTAKALKLSYATGVNTGVTAPIDSTNGYVYALYNVGIVNGVNVGAYNYWYGSRSITRAEISKIICMVADYAESK